MSRPIRDTATLQQLTAGYRRTDTSVDCLFCAQTYRQGHIHPHGNDLLDAEHAMKTHLVEAHGSVFHALLELGKKGTGLSDTQRTLLGYFNDGLSDREIQPLAGDVSLSTIRNHRFTLREKARQAKVFIALMELLERGDQDPSSRFIRIPGRLSADDERFAITRAEFDKIVKANFTEGPNGPLARMPKKQKHKVAVLIQVLKRFDASRRYAQTEVNEILAGVSDDYTTLCRYLVDFGFLGRTRDGAEYWVE